MLVQTALGDPFVLQLHLVRACSERCAYCYLRDEPPEALLIPEVVYNLLRRVDAEAAAYGIRVDITLTGGDVSAYPWLDEVMATVAGMHRLRGLYLMVNRLSRPEVFSAISRWRNALSLVQVNLRCLGDSSDMDDLRALDDMRIPVELKVFVSSDHSLQAQVERVRLIKRHVPSLLVSMDRLCPVDPEQTGLVVSSEEATRAVGSLADEFGIDFLPSDPFVSAELKAGGRAKSEENVRGGCIIGFAGAAVFPSGRVVLCPRIPSLRTGVSVEDFSLIEFAETFSSLRGPWVEECRACVRTECLGGCPATAFASEGRLDRDIHCPYRSPTYE